MQGTIPYLGTFLTDLVMLDTAMKDYLEVGTTNSHCRLHLLTLFIRCLTFLLMGGCRGFCKRRIRPSLNLLLPPWIDVKGPICS